jgi:AcrR family transcriptional regulator
MKGKTIVHLHIDTAYGREPLPAMRQITKEWGVALATATKVLAALRQDGLVSAIPGIGTVVTQENKAVPVRRPRRTRDVGVVRTAVEIADSEGIAEVSMRRIASELGVATMSLYRHVPGKDELVNQMIDSVMGTVELPDATSDLRADLTEIAHRQWRMFRAHPWLASALSVTRPQLVPNGMRMTERTLARLRAAGLSLEDAMYVHIVLISYVRGIATAIELEDEAVRESGTTPDEYMAAQEAAFSAIVADEMPNLAELAAKDDFDLELDLLFEFGLVPMLDGLDKFVAARAK